MSWNRSDKKCESMSKCDRNVNFKLKFILILLPLIVTILSVKFGMDTVTTHNEKPLRAPSPRRAIKTNVNVCEREYVSKEKIESACVNTNIVPSVIKKPGTLQLPDGRVLTFRPPKEGVIKKVYSHGRVFECDHLGNFTEVTKRQLFDTAFEENFLALAVGQKSFIPAFLTGLDESEVKNILQKDYVMKGDETEEEKQRLKSYYDLKCNVLLYMEEGGKFSDFIKDISDFNVKEREARALCMSEVIKLYKEGNYEDARVTFETANKITEDKGYRPIKLPEHIRNAIGIDQ